MVRVEQEQVQQRTTRRRKAKTVINENLLIQAKREYLDGVLDLADYQKRMRKLSYRYIQVYDTSEKDDLDYEPKQN
jgi:hypothetical protein